MRYWIAGFIGFIWGGAILASWIARGTPIGTGAYGAGENLGVLLGAVLFGGGTYYLIKAFTAGNERDK